MIRHRTIVALVALATLAATAAFAQAKRSTSSMPRYKLVELPLRPLAISALGSVAGTTPDQKAALWTSRDGLQKIDLPAEFPIAEAAAINRQGDAVGTAYSADSGRRLAFLFRQRKVLILAGEQSRALGINDAGTIVGRKTMLPKFWASAALALRKPFPNKARSGATPMTRKAATTPFFGPASAALGASACLQNSLVLCSPSTISDRSCCAPIPRASSCIRQASGNNSNCPKANRSPSTIMA
ncbi:MAG: hypothetical protein LAO22_09635 [Acidobacteriia bacterium]|nr:hypothetical protein [Terriglobia bacterium]